jgi:hypothetical protein
VLCHDTTRRLHPPTFPPLPGENNGRLYQSPLRPTLAPHRHGSACPGQLSRQSTATGGPDKPDHDEGGMAVRQYQRRLVLLMKPAYSSIFPSDSRCGGIHMRRRRFLTVRHSAADALGAGPISAGHYVRAAGETVATRDIAVAVKMTCTHSLPRSILPPNGVTCVNCNETVPDHAYLVSKDRIYTKS